MTNKEEYLIFALTAGAFSFISLTLAQDVQFPGDGLNRGSGCKLPDGRQGSCEILSSCPYALDRYKSAPVSHCFFEGVDAYVCCPNTQVAPPVRVINPTAVNNVVTRVSSPIINNFECGLYFPTVRESDLYEGEDSGEINDFYRLVYLLREIRDAGFEIKEVDYLGNLVTSFVWNNGTADNWERLPIFSNFVLGGRSSRYALSRYMALLGQRRGQENVWLCDGVVLNDYWVITAAHCFNSRRRINVVRLGEYDYNNDTDFARPQDFGVSEVLIHPQYQPPIAYHDLALVRLSEQIIFSRYINPVCLPWGEKAEVDLTDSTVALTGWGATSAGGPSTSLLQEANVTVFDQGTCETGYSTLPFYSSSFPNGFGGGTICAGDEFGGVDACQGDSGGPVVYIDTDVEDPWFRAGKFTLAGIVSTGHGCGAAEFPGIYMDIRHGPYLNWIKQVAFKDY